MLNGMACSRQPKSKPEVIDMGILREKVRKAFDAYRAGDLKTFAHGLVDAGDVRYGFHRQIVDEEVDKQLSEL